MVRRVWNKHDRKALAVRMFALSSEPRFGKILVEVAGSYLDPTEKALALSLDEKSPVQAFDFSRPIRPFGQGPAEGHEDDDRRFRRTTPLGALEVGMGTVAS